MAQQNQKTISWQAPEFRYYEKNLGWYVTLVAISILIVAFFALQADLFAAVTTAILAVLVILFSLHKPSLVDIELSPKGVQFGRLLYPYKQIKHFWIVHNENHKTANFNTNTYINNIVILELESQDPEEVRQFLRQYLHEHEQTDETLVQRIIHKFKF